MDFLPLRPLRLSLDLDRRIEEAFEELIHEPWGRELGPAWQPAVDVRETEDAYLIEADLPGVAPEQVEVRVDGRRLTIRGSRHSLTWCREESSKTILIERQRGQFLRTLDLEHAVDPEKLETHFEHGILQARLPKKKGLPAPGGTRPSGRAD
jgi:HSP20 family protein